MSSSLTGVTVKPQANVYFDGKCISHSLTQADGLPSGLIFDTLYGATTLDLGATPADYGQLGPLGIPATPNRTRTGAALQALRPAPGTRGANSTFLNALYPLGATDLTSGVSPLLPILSLGAAGFLAAFCALRRWTNLTAEIGVQFLADGIVVNRKLTKDLRRDIVFVSQQR